MKGKYTFLADTTASWGGGFNNLFPGKKNFLWLISCRLKKSVLSDCITVYMQTSNSSKPGIQILTLGKLNRIY